MDSPADRPLPDRAVAIVAGATVLAILYFARDVLIPVTLAIILSLAIAPLVRLLQRTGLSHTFAVLGAVLLLAITLSAITGAVGVQLARTVGSLPQYERTIQSKVQWLNDTTIGRINALAGQAGRLIGARRVTRTDAASEAADAARGGTPANPPALPAPDAPSNPMQIVAWIIASVWVPLETAGIVLVVLIFVLLEHESLRDRFIRIAGGSDIRLTTNAINDAGGRLSRFFVSQFAVNFGFGVTLWIGLTILGLPHALLWAALAGILRFVPYVGIWIAAVFSVIVAAAVDPHWSLAAATLGMFAIVEVVAAQLIEPQLFGHTTGLSPLSVVIAAIFWSWLWGPIGLILSTPLTLCLLVAGRHIKAFGFLEILLGDTQALTMPQRFYQRALSGDSAEIISSARAFLKRNSFAAYCDLVLMPAFHLARIDVVAGTISSDQQGRVRGVVLTVISALGWQTRKAARRDRRISVLAHSHLGGHLRRQREHAAAARLGAPAAAAPESGAAESAVLCFPLGAGADDLAAELLVLILREQRFDARHMSLADAIADTGGATVGASAAAGTNASTGMIARPGTNASADTNAGAPDAMPGDVSVAYVVSAFPNEHRRQGAEVTDALRRRFPLATVVALYLPGMLLQPQTEDSAPGADKAAKSFGEALQICLDLLRHPAPV